jgi:hypothetical protein
MDHRHGRDNRRKEIDDWDGEKEGDSGAGKKDAAPRASS